MLALISRTFCLFSERFEVIQVVIYFTIIISIYLEASIDLVLCIFVLLRFLIVLFSGKITYCECATAAAFISGIGSILWLWLRLSGLGSQLADKLLLFFCEVAVYILSKLIELLLQDDRVIVL